MIPVARGEEGAEHQQTLGEYVCPTLGAGGSPHERQCAQSMEASDMLQAARGLDGCITHDGQTRPVGSSNSVDGSGDFWRHPMSTRQPPRRTILQCSFRRCWSRNFESLPWIGRCSGRRWRPSSELPPSVALWPLSPHYDQEYGTERTNFSFNGSFLISH
ncbi:hypothetical protein CDL15_Pgr028667 [Punica granatum]|uniref:Uncharacterized protein n=1 Tax=Punica granatum TaxID=22663 RepID=A0A218VXF0_PUNGR|nr:hypothetical protein CDL15_Pgr028667 [Punica granatum]